MSTRVVSPLGMFRSSRIPPLESLRSGVGRGRVIGPVLRRGSGRTLVLGRECGRGLGPGVRVDTVLGT